MSLLDYIKWYWHFWTLQCLMVRTLAGLTSAFMIWQPNGDPMTFLRVHRRQEYILLRAIRIEIESMYE